MKQTTQDAEFIGYHQFRKDDGTEYGSFEVFREDNSDPLLKAGWYWWRRHRNYMAESAQAGPFPTAEGAYLDALEGPKYKPEDLLGYPTLDDTPINFLDELEYADPKDQADYADLIKRRKLSNYILPDGTINADAVKNSNTLEANILARKLMS